MIIIVSQSIQIPVLATGNGWLAVDKPAGVTVHNQSGHDLCSYAAAFIQQDPQAKKQIGMDPEFGVHPVHRLDKETSGVILLAATREMFRSFSNQFESRQVKKQYIALLHGRLEHPDAKDSSGIWNWPLSKTAGGRKYPQGPAPRQACETRFRILAHSAHYTMVEIELLSGRIHQIRRHAKLAGHPVVGDGRYGSIRAASYLKQHHGFDRLALHARALTVASLNGKKSSIMQTLAIPSSMRVLFEKDSIQE